MFNLMALPTTEHKSDGSLPRMTPKQRRAAVKLIWNICSNYDNGNCLLLDYGEECICPQTISFSVNCKFFRHIILEDADGLSLKTELFRDDTVKKCVHCGKVYQSKSNNAKYCGDCSKNVLRKQKAMYARKHRAKIEK